jgi:flagellar hook-associated protein FlgK
LSPTATYTTTADSSTITVKTNVVHTYKNGDTVYLSAPASDVDGIDSAVLGGYFVINNVTDTGFTIESPISAQTGGSFDRANVTAKASLATSETGTNTRTDGSIITSLAGNTTSPFYTVKATVGVKNADGSISTSVITYRIDNLGDNVRNKQFAAQAVTGDGQIVTPNTNAPAMRAVMVDANGNELPIVNNAYVTSEQGYLKLVSDNPNYFIAIDSLNSAELGKINSIPQVLATNRGFSHYFELNNLFSANRTTGSTDSVSGSAKNMAVSSSLLNNANLLSLGKLSPSPLPVDPSAPPTYTYERTIGDNSIIDQLARFSTNTVTFGAAGDLGANSQSLTAYAGQMISTVSTKSTTNQSELDNASLLLDGFTSRSDSVRGVNLDEELANTIIYQNAYSASARIITVANEFFDQLMNIVK